MLKSHEKFHSSNGKRLILVADDEMINRELMGVILSDEYELIYAENGRETINKAREFKDTLSLILLDLMMPVLSGYDALKEIKQDPELKKIPVIVLTADQKAEVESLKIGAADFIPKPYPDAGVILARVLRTIELSEDRQIIQSTERDPLTGLYNREYFYRYAEQYDQHHMDTPMDAIVIDINHFHMINERFGTAYGDEVLKRIGERVREMVGDTGGIVCRRAADMFMVYCPHGKNYNAILGSASIGLNESDIVNNRIRLRMGVYECVDKTMEIERRFDRAKMAADTVRNSFNKSIGMYDENLHKRELYQEQLIEDFHKAIDEKQFIVYYQPKFDVRLDIPVLASAEALVRWQHPVLGMVSPGDFIPLFEDNGLIQELDNYVWRSTAEQIRDWKDRFGFAVPVSVNMSRIDMYDPDLINTLQRILDDSDLTPKDLYLEITESAYTQDSEQIIKTVSELRDMGFKIEMDDFGTGYSSLNMISTLPIDALKLDMQFIRMAFSDKRDTRMLEVIIDIADYLAVPVIAEGVETEEQLHALKAMGCDIVQGYYFSRPVPADEYEKFIIERKGQDDVEILVKTSNKTEVPAGGEASFNKIAYALSTGFECIYYIDTDNNHYVEFSSDGKYEDLQIEKSGSDFFTDTAKNIPRSVYEEDKLRVSVNMQKDSLMSQLADGKTFSMTYRLMIDGEPAYYSLKAVKANTHDDHHIVVGLVNVDEQIKQAAGTGHDIHSFGDKEMQLGDIIANAATYSSIARALAKDYFLIYYVNIDNEKYVEYRPDDEYRELNIDEGGANFFTHGRDRLSEMVIHDDRREFLKAFTKENIVNALEGAGLFTLICRISIEDEPVYVNIKISRIYDSNDPHIVVGISNIDAQVKREKEYASALRAAREAAYRDPLTGVKSNMAYKEEEEALNERIASGRQEAFALLICDVNNLKAVNDAEGHAAGDELLRNACMMICEVFAHSPVYRYGGDEFAAILRGQDYYNRESLVEELVDISMKNAAESKAAVACGMAIYDKEKDDSVADIFARADQRMYENKELFKKTYPGRY